MTHLALNERKLDEHDNPERSTRAKKGRESHGNQDRRYLLAGKGSRVYQAHTRERENHCRRRESRVCAHGWHQRERTLCSLC